MPFKDLGHGVLRVGRSREEIVLKSMVLKNFKSFRDMHLDLRKFNVVIGANASGKSNLTSVFKFLQDVRRCELDDAILMHGGIEFIRNREIGASEDLSIDLHFVSKAQGLGKPIKMGKNLSSCEAKELSYSFSIGFTGNKTGYFVREEKLTGTFEIRKVVERKKGPRKGEKLAEGKITLTRDKEGQIRHSLIPKNLPIKIEEIFPFLGLHQALHRRSQKSTMRHTTYIDSLTDFSPVFGGIATFLDDLEVYDLDPKMPKRPTRITGKAELESDGSNLAVVLREITRTKKKKERITRLMKDLLPFFEDISVSRLADRSLFTYEKESYGRASLPASLLSDGTINLTALVVALYFERKPFIVIEEPERNIHPSLISKLIGMMKDVSERMGKQILVTTHNPEVVRHTSVENLILAYRNEKGFSEMSNPSDKKEVQEFLKADMGIEELYIQNLLEE